MFFNFSLDGENRLIQTANYRCFLLITGKPVESKNRQKNLRLNFFWLHDAKNRFLIPTTVFAPEGGLLRGKRKFFSPLFL
jgi:hypothetical protein